MKLQGGVFELEALPHVFLPPAVMIEFRRHDIY